MTLKQIRVMEELKEVAKQSNMRCKHAAAIVDSKYNIICTGYNYYTGNYSKCYYYQSVHAERDVLQRCNVGNIDGCDLYVIRWGCNNPGNSEYMMSAPCQRCESLINKYIEKYNLNKVYYSLHSNINKNNICLKSMN